MLRYTFRAIAELTDQEFADCRERMAAGMIVCPTCGEWVSILHRVPERYRKFLRMARTNEFLSIAIPNRICLQCFVDAIDRARKLRARQYDEQCGKLRISLSEGNRKEKRGFVYVARYRDVFKIGATQGTMTSRLQAQKIPISDFVLALETDHPFDLEKHLHAKFRYKQKKIDKSVEMFDLSDEDLKWMTKIHELNGAKIVCHLFPDEGGADEP